YKQSEIKQGRSPSRLDGVISDPGVLKMPREREELESTLKIYECHVAEIQGNFKVLTAESHKTVNLYEQAQEESSQLHREVIKCPRTPKSTVIVQAVLRRMEIERDTALLREQVQISQETAFNEKAHLEQRIEELETTVHKVRENNYLWHFKYNTGDVHENFSRQSLLQQEDICALKEAIAQLNKEKPSLQNCVEEGRESIATSEESLAIKVSLRVGRENCELLENYHKAREQGESWEAKCHEAETDFSCYTGTGPCRLLTTEAAYKCSISALSNSLVKMGGEPQNIRWKRGSVFANVTSTQEICIKLDKVERLLREQLGNERASMKNLESVLVSNCEKAFRSQRAKQEKDSEIQFLKEQLALVENNLAVQNQDFTHLRNRAAQLESELDITKIQLETELFDKQVYVFVLCFLQLIGVKCNIVLRLISQINNKVWVCTAVHLLYVQRLFMSLNLICSAVTHAV
uniref:Uncharacterized protein n=1 Tax=Corvus moneduloides TaxID=1196302 RepID=A0A8U7M3P0_CORMO